MDIQTIYSKIASVPPAITSWLGSDATINTIEKSEVSYTLPRGSSGIIAKLIQRIQIKDLAPDYFSGELAAELQLDKDKATHITSEFKKSVFSPIRKNFADYGIDIDLLDKFQMPIIKSSSESPKIFQNIESESTFNPNIQAQIAPSLPRPTTLSDIGWSKQPAASLSNTIRASAPAPIPTPKPAVPAEPAPMMLHEDTTFKPAERNAGFTLSNPGGTAEMSLVGSNAQPPTRPAVLEFGGRATSTGMAVPKPPISAINSVRPMTVSGGARNVSQILPTMSVPVPKPPTPPMPPRPPQAALTPSSQVPQPPKPPAPQATARPIVKDFL